MFFEYLVFEMCNKYMYQIFVYNTFNLVFDKKLETKNLSANREII